MRNGHLPSQHFKDEDPQSPPVNCSAMTFALDNFRGQVLRSATQSPGSDQLDKVRMNNLNTVYNVVKFKGKPVQLKTEL